MAFHAKLRRVRKGRNCSRPVPTVQLLCMSLNFLVRACAERADASVLSLERLRDAGSFVRDRDAHLCRRAQEAAQALLLT